MLSLRFKMHPNTTARTPSLSLFFLAAAYANAAPSDSYICVADHSVGFSYNKSTREWGPTTFKTTEKLLIARATPDEKKRGFSWMIKELGSDFPSFGCKDDFTDRGSLSCKGFGDFMFNQRNGRYLSTYMIGYVGDRLGPETSIGEEGANTPAMTVGKCSAIPTR